MNFSLHVHCAKAPGLTAQQPSSPPDNAGYLKMLSFTIGQISDDF